MSIDLHVHSNASDGSLSPAEILERARSLCLGAVAITDHDTVEGSRQAQDLMPVDGPRFLTGLEISAGRPPVFPGPGSFHLLGYGIRLDDPVLNRTLQRLQSARAQRNPRIMERLRHLGMDLTLAEVAEAAGTEGQIGRPHIAAAMVRKGFVASIDAAFDRYLGTGQPAYVDKYRVDCADAIRIIAAAGGIAVLAHPGLLNIRDHGLFHRLLEELKDMGLGGLEAYYPEHTPEQTEGYLAAAKRFGLLVTGGTDFHGAVKPDIEMGHAAGDFTVPYAIYEQLAAAL